MKKGSTPIEQNRHHKPATLRNEKHKRERHARHTRNGIDSTNRAHSKNFSKKARTLNTEGEQERSSQSKIANECITLAAGGHDGYEGREQKEGH